MSAGDVQIHPSSLGDPVGEFERGGACRQQEIARRLGRS
jgi:hypothetical protein